MAIFMDCVCYRVANCDSTRIPEALRIIKRAMRGVAPAQFNSPGGMWTKVLDVELHASETPEWSPGGPKSTLDAPSVQHELLAFADQAHPGGHQ